MIHEHVRVLRILEYSGPREWVEFTMEKNAIKGTWKLPNGGTIREAFLGEFPEVIGEMSNE